MSQILRGGRLGKMKDEVVRFISSVEADRRISRETILVNKAHVIALAKAKAIENQDAHKLFQVLIKIEQAPPFRESVEDVHVLVEEEVTRILGKEVGGRLHTGKSRNDQVATAIRIASRNQLLTLIDDLTDLENRLLRLAKKHTKSLFIGYTHLQPAQPVSFAHYLVSIHDALERDNQRILETFARVNQSSLGGGAIAGSSFRLDRHLTARLLGFDGIVENSIDAVTGRDFLVETLNVCSLIAADLSRLAQDLIFYSSEDVGRVELPDAFTSTSSIMPQKKNPDSLEIVRARCALVAGNGASALTLMHGLSTGYNLDFQELTPLLWNSLDIVRGCLSVLSGLIPELRLSSSITGKRHLEFTAATELANAITREGKIPYRDAYRMVGQAVGLAHRESRRLKELGADEWRTLLGKSYSDTILREVGKILNLETHLERYKTIGSPNPKMTAKMIATRSKQLQLRRYQVDKKRSKLAKSSRLLRQEARKFA